MKRKMFTLSLLFCLIFVQFQSGFTSASEKSNSITFSIPANSFCDISHTMQMSINVTNVADTDVSVSLHLYKEDGSELKYQGINSNGIKSNILLDGETTIKAGFTAFYNYSFGGPLENCLDRVYTGKIVLNTSGSIIASGWIRADNGNSTIIINNGSPFSVEGNPSTPEPTCKRMGTGNDLIPAMTSDTTPKGKAIASSTYIYQGEEVSAYRAFDNCEYVWHSGDKLSLPQWIGYEFEEPTTVNTYSITPGVDTSFRYQQAPKNFSFEAYDGSGWVTLDTRLSITNWENGVSQTFTFNNSNPYKSYRLVATANNGYKSSHLVIGELEFYFQ